ncbi:hypothetical protein [Paraburkholderia sp.]|uniref:hypothetical protein n=1 Tax=Paraburkholderia sp. TaxID=1926495 RepID=UPI0025D7BF7A|nr:hypothetical protein [Paraburkholderia sp.]
MHTVCLPSSAWRTDERAVQSFLHCVAGRDATQPASILVDTSAILRHAQVVHAEHEVCAFEFSDWVRIGFTAEGVLDIERIRNDCAVSPAGSIVVVKANGFESDLIVRALHQMRIGLFTVAKWPYVVAVVCDDSQVFQVAPPLSSTFYLQPAVLNPATSRRVAKQIADECKSLKWFGRSVGALPTLLRRWVAMRRKARDRKMNRGFGWVWDE